MTEQAAQQDAIYQQALAWHVALDAPSADWDGFTLWLEAAAAHREAYDAVAMIDDAMATHQPVLAAVLTPADPHTDPDGAATLPSRSFAAGSWRRFGWRGAAGLGAVAAAAGLALVWTGSTTATYESGATNRTIALADGSSVVLSPRSVLVVADADSMTMRRGAAYFDIRHRPERQLTISANGYRLTDIGTTFDVNVADGSSLSVTVASGNVAVRHAVLAQPITLRAGQRLTGSRGGAIGIDSAEPADIASWRDGQLVYADTPIAIVAADVARYSGVAVTVDPALRTRRFTGVLDTASGPAMIGGLAEILDVSTVQSTEGVRLAPHNDR